MDACVMDGQDFSAGAVAGVRHIKNPIVLANEVRLYLAHDIFCLIEYKGLS